MVRFYFAALWAVKSFFVFLIYHIDFAGLFLPEDKLGGQLLGKSWLYHIAEVIAGKTLAALKLPGG